MKMKFSYLNDNSGHKSSMRWNVRLLAIGAFILLMSISGYIFVRSLGNGISGGEWAGIGGFITSLAIFITGVLYNQQTQKKSELKSENSEKIKNI